MSFMIVATFNLIRLLSLTGHCAPNYPGPVQQSDIYLRFSVAKMIET